MALTAAQTADAGAPQVGVTIDGLSTSVPVTVVVTTSWDAGVTWQPVRGGTVSGVLGSTFVRDFVPALNVPITYRATLLSGDYLSRRTNLATNPSVETGTTGWQWWMGVGGTASAAQGSIAYSGTSGFTATWSVAPTAGGGVLYDTGATLSPNTTYTFSMYVQSSVAVTVTPQYQFYAGGTPTTNATAPTGVTVPANTWTRVSQTATTGSTDNQAQFRAYVTSGIMTVGSTLTGDALLIEQGSTLGAYFDGASVGSSATYAWTGTANASTSTESTTVVTSAPVTVNSDTAWIQDPLAPRSAVPLYADMTSGHVLLTIRSLAGGTWGQQVDLAVPVGSSLAAASMSVRQKIAGLPLALMYNVAAEGGALKAMLMKAGQLVIRGLPVSGLLDPVAHVVAGDANELRFASGTISEWMLTARQVQPVTMRVVVPWWTYDQVLALVQSQISSSATYAQVLSAQPAGKTYTQWVANPGVAS